MKLRDPESLIQECESTLELSKKDARQFMSDVAFYASNSSINILDLEESSITFQSSTIIIETKRVVLSLFWLRNPGVTQCKGVEIKQAA